MKIYLTVNCTGSVVPSFLKFSPNINSPFYYSKLKNGYNDSLNYNKGLFLRLKYKKIRAVILKMNKDKIGRVYAFACIDWETEKVRHIKFGITNGSFEKRRLGLKTSDPDKKIAFAEMLLQTEDLRIVEEDLKKDLSEYNIKAGGGTEFFRNCLQVIKEIEVSFDIINEEIYKRVKADCLLNNKNKGV